MSRLLAPFIGNLLLSAGIFVVLFVLIALLIARKDFGGLIGGIMRSILSYFYSPFIFLKKSTSAIARYSHEGEARFAESEQYLLNKLILMLSAVILLVAVGILTVGALQGVLHGREWVRLNKRIGEATRELAMARQEKTRLDTYLVATEDEWNNHRDRLVAGYQKQRERMADSMNTANRQLEQRLIRALESDPTAAQLFASILNYMATNAESPSWRWRQVRDDIQSAVDRSSASQENKDLMKRHAENWYEIRLTLIPPSEMGERELRRIVQPARDDSTSRAEYLNGSIPEQETSLQELQSEAQREGRDILWKPVEAFLKFIAFVWAAGLVLEALALAVLTAGNIRRLREKSEEAGPRLEPAIR